MVKVSNFRDIGGLSLDNGKKIKQGLVYRSSHLDSIKKKDFIQLINFYFWAFYPIKRVGKHYLRE